MWNIRKEVLQQAWIVLSLLNFCSFYALAQPRMDGILMTPKQEVLAGIKIFVEGFESQAVYTSDKGEFKLWLPEALSSQKMLRCFIISPSGQYRYGLSFPNEGNHYLLLALPEKAFRDSALVGKKNGTYKKSIHEGRMIIRNDPAYNTIDQLDRTTGKFEKEESASSTGIESIQSETKIAKESNEINHFLQKEDKQKQEKRIQKIKWMQEKGMDMSKVLNILKMIKEVQDQLQEEEIKKDSLLKESLLVRKAYLLHQLDVVLEWDTDK